MGKSSREDRHDLTRRLFLKRACQSAAVLSAASFGQYGAFFRPSPAWAGKVDPTGISIGIMAPSHCAAPYAYAAIKDLYAKNGANVTIKYYQNMLNIANDLISGKIQMGQLISPLFLSMHFKSAAFKKTGVPMVSPMFTGTNGGALVIKKDLPFNSLEDLGGMTIGSHSKLSVHYLLLMSLANREGAKFKKPVNIEILPLKEMIGSLKSGAIGGFIMPEPISAVAEAKGVGKVFKLSREIWPDHPCCLVASTQRFAGEHPDILNAVTLSLLEATLFANEEANRPEFINTIQQLEAYGNVPTPVLTKAFSAGRADFAPYPYRSSASTVAYMMKRFMLLPGKATREEVEKTFDTEGTRKLYAQVSGTPPEGDYREEMLLGKPLNF